ncbi:protein translocase subunit SecF, partial [Patescibacteria group bacterium]|nr:protein translocase subunit SecF [Patescibacteria group bacterium]
MSYNIIQKRKIWLSISGLLVALSLAAIIAWGLNLGIDFTGGSLLEVDFKSARPSAAEIQENLKDLGLGSLTAQPSGDNGVILRFQD